MKRIELTLCTDCKFHQRLILDSLSQRSHHSLVAYTCTHPTIIKQTMPTYAWKVFGENRFVEFVLVALSPELPVVPAQCPLLEAK